MARHPHITTRGCGAGSALAEFHPPLRELGWVAQSEPTHCPLREPGHRVGAAVMGWAAESESSHHPLRVLWRMAGQAVMGRSEPSHVPRVHWRRGKGWGRSCVQFPRAAPWPGGRSRGPSHVPPGERASSQSWWWGLDSPPGGRARKGRAPSPIVSMRLGEDERCHPLLAMVRRELDPSRAGSSPRPGARPPNGTVLDSLVARSSSRPRVAESCPALSGQSCWRR